MQVYAASMQHAAGQQRGGGGFELVSSVEGVRGFRVYMGSCGLWVFGFLDFGVLGVSSLSLGFLV